MKVVVRDNGSKIDESIFRKYTDVAEWLESHPEYVGKEIFIFAGDGLPNRITYEQGSIYIEGRGYV